MKQPAKGLAWRRWGKMLHHTIEHERSVIESKLAEGGYVRKDPKPNWMNGSGFFEEPWTHSLTSQEVKVRGEHGEHPLFGSCFHYRCDGVGVERDLPKDMRSGMFEIGFNEGYDAGYNAAVKELISPLLNAAQEAERKRND